MLGEYVALTTLLVSVSATSVVDHTNSSDRLASMAGEARR